MVCVGEVASSRAWCMMWSMMYDGSVEYGVSLEYDVVVVVAPKEQKIKKSTT